MSRASGLVFLVSSTRNPSCWFTTVELISQLHCISASNRGVPEKERRPTTACTARFCGCSISSTEPEQRRCQCESMFEISLVLPYQLMSIRQKRYQRSRNCWLRPGKENPFESLPLLSKATSCGIQGRFCTMMSLPRTRFTFVGWQQSCSIHR